MKEQRKSWLLAILLCSVAITSIHYTDNAIYVDRYPEPAWITTSGVFITWVIMTLIAAISYWLYSQQYFWWSYLLLGIYSLTGLSSPTHYIYGSMSQFSGKMHLFIWADAIAGLAVIDFVIRSALVKREWRNVDIKEIQE